MALLSYPHAYHPLLYTTTRHTQLIPLQAVELTGWSHPLPAWPDRRTPADASCKSSSKGSIDTDHMLRSLHFKGLALHRTCHPLPECRCSSVEVPKYPNIQASRANQIGLTKCVPTRTRMQRRPSRFSMSCPILPQHQSPPRPSSSNVTPRDCAPPRLGPFVSRFYQSTILLSRELFVIC